MKLWDTTKDAFTLFEITMFQRYITIPIHREKIYINTRKIHAHLRIPKINLNELSIRIVCTFSYRRYEETWENNSPHETLREEDLPLWQAVELSNAVSEKDCTSVAGAKKKEARKRNCARGGPPPRRRVDPPSGYALGVSRVIKYKVNSFVELGGK